MSVTNGKVSATDPIGLEEITELLKEKSVDVGTVCSSQNINIWSLRRPIFSTRIEPLDDGIRKTLNWGYTIPTFSSRASIKAQRWTSDVGGVYRLTDFAGYDHNAVKFLPTLTGQTINKAYGLPYTLQLTSEMTSEAQLRDLEILITYRLGLINLADCYLGVVLYQSSNSSTRYYFFNPEPGIFRNIDVTPNLNFNPADDSTWYAILFATPELSTTPGGADLLGTYISLDQLNVSTIRFVYDDGFNIELRNLYYSNGVIKGEVHFSNTTEGRTIGFNNITLAARNGNPGTANYGGETIEDVSLTTKSKVIKSFEINLVGAWASVYDWWVYLTVSVYNAPGHAATSIPKYYWGQCFVKM